MNASLRRQESSTMKMEAKTKEAEANMTAAQKLLNAAWTAWTKVIGDRTAVGKRSEKWIYLGILLGTVR